MLLGNPTVPGWQRWMLAPSDASRKPDNTRLAAMDARPIGCFQETRRYQVGSDGCSPHRMLLGNPTLPGWQRWMLAPSDAFRKPDVTRTSHESARRNKTPPATTQLPSSGSRAQTNITTLLYLPTYKRANTRTNEDTCVHTCVLYISTYIHQYMSIYVWDVCIRTYVHLTSRLGQKHGLQLTATASHSARPSGVFETAFVEWV